jgi:hypothetical protein
MAKEKIKKPRASRKKKVVESLNAMAVHGTDGETHVVGLGNVKVIVCQDEEGTWLAQGLEIDYLATGDSSEQAKKNFEVGLRGTIDLHIKIHHSIDHLLNIAPQSVWDELKGMGTRYRYSQVSFHEDLFKNLPYGGINFIEQAGVAA